MGIFVLIFFVALVCLVVGLVKPKAFAKLLGASVSRKKVGLIFGLATFVSMILIGATAEPKANPPQPEESKVAQQPAATSTEVAKAPEVKTPEPAPAPTPEPVVKQETTLDKLWKALDVVVSSRDGFDISFDEKTKTAKLTYTVKNAWDENSFVKSAYTALVKYGTEVFKIDGVDALTINNKTTFTDAYGKSALEDAVILTMPKTEFMKYDWEGLKYRSVSSQMEQSCTKYYIHPALLKNIDDSKLYLNDTITK